MILIDRCVSPPSERMQCQLVERKEKSGALRVPVLAASHSHPPRRGSLKNNSTAKTKTQQLKKKLLCYRPANKAKCASRKKICNPGEPVFIESPQTIDGSRQNASEGEAFASGLVIGEYDANQIPIYETIYLNDTPVAIIKQTRTGNPDAQPSTLNVTTEVYHVYSDHIDTPRLITKASDQAIVWSWHAAEPFGVTQPNSNPNNLGTFTFNQRFPGQVFDSESGLFQNHHREFQGLGGRYLTPDPIGLEGGSLSLYTYVSSNPLKFTDPAGLQALPMPVPVPTPNRPGTTPGTPGPKPLYPDFPGSPTYTPAPPDVSLPGIRLPFPFYPAMSLITSLVEMCSPDSDSERAKACKKQLDSEEKLCVAIAGSRYGGNKPKAIRICEAAAMQRYAACLKGTPAEQRPPLTGVDTPI